MAWIVFEGLDGSGKSSLIQGINRESSKLSIPTFLTREPGGTPLGEEIRELILKMRSTAEDAPSSKAELLLYEASRHQHVSQLILPKLSSGFTVLCDRFSWSSLAFQGQGRDIQWSEVGWLNDFATDNHSPHFVVLIDLPVKEALSRVHQRSQKDRIENESMAFFERVREGYLKIADIQKSEGKNNFVVLDGLRTPEELVQQALPLVLHAIRTEEPLSTRTTS